MRQRPPLELPPLDEQAGPAERISTRRSAALVSGSLDASRRAVVPWARRFAVAAAFALTAGSVASAAYVVRHWRTTPDRVASEAPEISPPRPRAAARQVGVGVAVPAPPPPVAADPVDDPGLGAPAPLPRKHPSRSAAAHGPAVAAAQVDLLRSANALRALSRWRDAERVYRQVSGLASGSDEAYAAVVAAASLRLEHLNDPAGALALFRAALRTWPSGALAEEARWGIVEAHHTAGHTNLEVVALRDFMWAHPGSLRMAKAEARLAAATAPASVP